MRYFLNAQATNIYFAADSVTVEVGPFYPSQSITREGVWQLVCTNEAFNVNPATELTYADPVVDAFEHAVLPYGEATVDYYLYTPEGGAKNMPLVLFNSGGTGISPTGDIYGANFAVSFAKDDAQAIMPAYVLYPQRTEAAIEDSIDGIKSIIDGLVTAGKVDPNRIYITGESAGGGFTFDFLDRYPGYFAAAIFNPMRYSVGGNMKTLAKSGTKVMLIESIGDDDSARPEDVARIYNALKENGMEPGVDLIWHYYTAETFNALTGDNTNWLTMNDGSYITDPITGVTSYIYPGSMLHNSSYPGANDNYIKVWLMNQSKAGYSVKFENGYSAKYYTEHPEEGEDYSVIPDYYTKAAVLDGVPLVPAGETGTATVYTDEANEHWYIVWEGGFGPNRGMQYVECIVVGGIGYVVMDCSGGWWTADITSGTMPHLLGLPSIDWQPYAG